MQGHPESHPQIQQHITRARSHPGHTGRGGGTHSSQSQPWHTAHARQTPPPADPGPRRGGGRGGSPRREGAGRSRLRSSGRPRSWGWGRRWRCSPPPRLATPRAPPGAPHTREGEGAPWGDGRGPAPPSRTLRRRGTLHNGGGVARLRTPQDSGSPSRRPRLSHDGGRPRAPARYRPLRCRPRPRSGPAPPPPPRPRLTPKFPAPRADTLQGCSSPSLPPPARAPLPRRSAQQYPPHRDRRRRWASRSRNHSGNGCSSRSQRVGGAGRGRRRSNRAERRSGIAVTAPPGQCPRGRRRSW